MAQSTNSQDNPQSKAQQLKQRQKEENQARANGYHRTFVQSEDGAKILQEWMGAYVLGGFTPDDAGITELAKAEARREFVCSITELITLAENPL